MSRSATARNHSSATAAVSAADCSDSATPARARRNRVTVLKCLRRGKRVEGNKKGRVYSELCCLPKGRAGRLSLERNARSLKSVFRTSVSDSERKKNTTKRLPLQSAFGKDRGPLLRPKTQTRLFLSLSRSKRSIASLAERVRTALPTALLFSDAAFPARRPAHRNECTQAQKPLVAPLRIYDARERARVSSFARFSKAPQERTAVISGESLPEKCQEETNTKRGAPETSKKKDTRGPPFSRRDLRTARERDTPESWTVELAAEMVDQRDREDGEQRQSSRLEYKLSSKSSHARLADARTTPLRAQGP